MRMRPARYVKRTVITPPATSPKPKYRASGPLWSRPSAITRRGSRKAYCASTKLTPCLMRLARSFASSHSKLGASGICMDIMPYQSMAQDGSDILASRAFHIGLPISAATPFPAIMRPVPLAGTPADPREDPHAALHHVHELDRTGNQNHSRLAEAPEGDARLRQDMR